VQPLGQREEARIAGDYPPLDVDPQVLDVSDQRLEHLSHAASGGGRTDVPDGATREPCAEGVGGGKEGVETFGANNALEVGDRTRRHPYSGQFDHEYIVTVTGRGSNSHSGED
jgi:hypothetical protein